MALPNVSIVLPTYNGSQYLSSSIESCLGQTHSNIELIIVDDGSTDRRLQDILNNYHDPRVQVIRHDKNKGLPVALNTGFAKATGEYLTWTSDDNIYDASAIAKMVDCLVSNPGTDFVYCRAWLVNETGEIISELKTAPVSELKNYNCVGACFLYTRKVYETIGDYNSRVSLSEDYEYWVRVAQIFAMMYCDEKLYYKREHRRSLTSMNYGGYKAQRLTLDIRQKYWGLDSRDYARQMADLWVDEAFESHKHGDRKNVIRASLRGLLHDWHRIYNRGLLSIIAEALSSGIVKSKMGHE